MRSISIALGGGGIRGLSHIGVLKALDRAGIQPKAIAGTSVGGLVGATYAAQVSPVTLEYELSKLTGLTGLLGLGDWWPGKRSLLSGKNVYRFFASLLGEAETFDDLTIPFAVVAVDLISGDEVILREGDLSDALGATMALPGLFDPVRIDGRLLVDGGLRNSIPADVARTLGGDLVIAVDVSRRDLQENKGMSLAKRWTIANDLWRAQAILMHALMQDRLAAAAPAFILQPNLPPGVTALGGIQRLSEIVEAGERAVEEILPQLLDALREDSDALEQTFGAQASPLATPMQDMQEHAE